MSYEDGKMDQGRISISMKAYALDEHSIDQCWLLDVMLQDDFKVNIKQKIW